MQKLNLVAPINSLGYGYTSLNILKALSNCAEVSLWPIGTPQAASPEDSKIIESAINNNATADLQAPCIKIWHQHDMTLPGHLTGLKIGFPIFELDTFSEVELYHLKSTDRLFVPSQWAVDMVRKNGIEVPCKVVPLGVDLNIFKQYDRDAVIPKVFFNCGKWEVRKGHDVLIQMWDRFCEELPNHDFQLWMMCGNPFNSPQEERLWTKTYQRGNIRLIPRVETHEEVYNIMSQVGCGIFPSRGEGWNLELLELMAAGKWCITTNYAAHTEFCSPDNATLIETPNKEAAFDGKWFFGSGNWAKIDDQEIEQFVKEMVSFAEWPVYNDKGVETAEKFTWDNAAREIIKHVSE